MSQWRPLETTREGVDTRRWTVVCPATGRAVARDILRPKEVQLIAAAPDLLEAAKELLGTWRTLQVTAPPPSRWPDSLTALEAAIARAEGRTL